MDELVNKLDVLIQAPVFFMSLYLIYSNQKTTKETVDNIMKTFKEMNDNNTKMFDKVIDKLNK